MLVLGHRGAPLAHPANTLPAFAAALEQGADGVELDVRRSADGALVLSHDAHLPDGRLIVATPRADLPESMPGLDEALDVLRPAALVNIEIKNWPDDADFDATLQLATDVVKLLTARGELDDGRNLVSCFHLPTVDRVHELAPHLGTAWLVFDAREPGPLIERTVEHGHVAIHPHQMFVTPELVDEAHAAGLAVNTWTCDDPERIAWLADIGVDALVTNDPPLALASLGR